MALLIVSESLATRCASINSQTFLVRPTIINLNSNELHYYLFMISLDRCNGSRNTLDDPSGTIFVPSKTKGVHLNVSKKQKH